MLFSKTAKQNWASGFFFDGDKNAPADAINVSDKDISIANNLPLGAAFDFDANGKLIVTPAPILSDAQIKVLTIAVKWESVKAKRDQIMLEGVKVGTKWYHTDEASRTKYIGLLRMADAAVAAGGIGSTTLQYGGQDIQWKTMDGTFIKMTVQRANDVFNAVSGLDFVAFGTAEAHKAAMEAFVDPASYDFTVGWSTTFGG